MTTPWLHTADSSRASRTPYAGPVHASDVADHVGEKAAEAAAERCEMSAPRPYVPVALRSRPPAPAVQAPDFHAPDFQASEVHASDVHAPEVDESYADASYSDDPYGGSFRGGSAVDDEDSLPWISEFLSAADAESPAAPSAPQSADPESSAAEADVQAEGERADDWPFADAGAQASELSVEMPSPDPFGDALLSGTTPAALPMWNDDDMMDIMPVRSASLDDADRQATDAAVQQEHSEAAARALEGLAARVRGGELALPGYESEMGDAAALAAALAALLGVRH